MPMQQYPMPLEVIKYLPQASILLGKHILLVTLIIAVLGVCDDVDVTKLHATTLMSSVQLHRRIPVQRL